MMLICPLNKGVPMQIHHHVAQYVYSTLLMATQCQKEDSVGIFFIKVSADDRYLFRDLRQKRDYLYSDYSPIFHPNATQLCTDCLSVWLAKSPSCPYCRCDFVLPEPEMKREGSKSGAWGIFDGVFDSIYLWPVEWRGGWPCVLRHAASKFLDFAALIEYIRLCDFSVDMTLPTSELHSFCIIESWYTRLGRKN